MALVSVRARFECDGCGRAMEVPIDPAMALHTGHFDVSMVAISAVRTGTCQHVGGSRRESSHGHSCSEYFGNVLCGECTTIADAMYPEPETWDEVKELL